jgi:DNA-binding winged helix-turn-helix (wHTH) protein
MILLMSPPAQMAGSRLPQVRQKLGRIGEAMIRTVPGIGYTLEPSAVATT